MKFNLNLSMAVMASAMVAVSACGGSGSSESASSESAAAAPPPAPVEISLEEKYKDDPIFIKGSELMGQNDCPSCHMLERKIVGPSYADVAAKYESTDENIELLAGKVIAGSVGTWGEIPMPAHPNLSEEDAKNLAKFVLLLKK
ncbi:c-type cytochrome [Cyclobacterium amurskyense]|jgi:cytochrome c|uniref:Cytochrome c class I n=1 Tax=Cyclobacterium amurskyense TaxID=320787 RepID=A0A0H4PAJ5_9BACT|nr:c-type cytochrome [Cyclobacterium amurskyense]AKP51229.1 Cytochrome c class I [Cyclobacterium amurskyense]|tara:strand:- start:13294 stop:13725 length:432 start_codon:yes stop_codon:yes gene_type:complete